MSRQSTQCRLAVILLGFIFPFLDSKIVRYTFRVSYIIGSPDGVITKNILGINGRFPGPLIEANTGDMLEVTVINNIQGGQNLTLHWHGIHQSGTPFEDGASIITQCPIKTGKTQVYKFPVHQTGTYWYHSHVNSQYTEGLWGVMIIRGVPEVWRNLYDEEILITLNDWYHTSGLENDKYLLSPRSNGAPPYPFSALMNGMGRYPCLYTFTQWRLCISLLQRRPVFNVQPGKTYRLRLVNTAGWATFNFTVEGHTLRTIEVDGVDTAISEPIQAVHIAAGQRYSFLLTVPRTGRIGRRFLIRASLITSFLFTRPGNINRYPRALIKEVTGVLVYSRRSSQTRESFRYTQSYRITEPWTELSFLDDFTLIPQDKVRAPSSFDRSVELNITFAVDTDMIRKGSFNGRPVMPSGMPQLAMMVYNQTIPESMFPVYISYGEIIQVVVNNPEEGPHPIHLHGHHFWVLGMGRKGDGNYNSEKHALNYNGLRRDTVLVKERSWMVIRFRADNVGVWTLHCHVDWHVLQGMLMVFVEAPELAHTIQVPDEAKRVCSDHGIII